MLIYKCIQNANLLPFILNRCFSFSFSFSHFRQVIFLNVCLSMCVCVDVLK